MISVCFVSKPNTVPGSEQSEKLADNFLIMYGLFNEDLYNTDYIAQNN
jgi:hypothetical protein